VERMEDIAGAAGRPLRQRTTVYGPVAKRVEDMVGA
jgi:hypothetical protein